ncbi:MAG: 5'-nucleotidase, lipoprotein e(P4) family [Bacteroidetes bacterium]|nr:5'-nucleotidase, lipoprotein e(P4) family [Bacteroidota bacterium]
MKTIKLITLTILFSLFVACNMVPEKQPVNNDSLLMATIYQQKSAEVEALCYQAYNIAELRLNQILENNTYKKPLAVVVDVDETVLDNSPFEAKSILENSDYPTYWKEWIELSNAKALSGAVEFLNYASSKGVETFYITNRKVEFHDATMKNLKDKGFPHVDEAHILLRSTESNKEARRQKVMETHDIVILMGDNLNDFTDLFEANSIAERHQNVIDLKDEFGKKFIILPNAMYGAWIDALMNYENLPKEEKLRKLKEGLEGF